MRKKAVIIIIGLAIIISLAAGKSYTYLTDSATRNNIVQAAAVNITIDEDGFIGNTVHLQPGIPEDKHVSIINEAEAPNGRSGTDAYIRVTLIPIWRNAEGGNAALPAGNVTLTPAASAAADWLKGKDGYYYYKYPVAPGGSTSRLLESVSWNLTGTNLDAEYQASHLEVQVLADAIQSESNAVENYWGVNVSGTGESKYLTLKEANTP